MTPNQIYALSPIKVENSLYHLDNFCHDFEIENMPNVDQNRITMRYYASECLDWGERSWSIFAIYFDNKPIAICQTAGRGGHDHTDIFVTDSNGFVAMKQFLRSLVDPKEFAVYDPDSDVPDLTYFWGHNWSDFESYPGEKDAKASS